MRAGTFAVSCVSALSQLTGTWNVTLGSMFNTCSECALSGCGNIISLAFSDEQHGSYAFPASCLHFTCSPGSTCTCKTQRSEGKGEIVCQPTKGEGVYRCTGADTGSDGSHIFWNHTELTIQGNDGGPCTRNGPCAMNVVMQRVDPVGGCVADCQGGGGRHAALYSCNSATGQCALDPKGSQSADDCIAGCKCATPHNCGTHNNTIACNQPITGCNVCDMCCKPWLTVQASCDGCFEAPVPNGCGGKL
jgi:hypothetical protein